MINQGQLHYPIHMASSGDLRLTLIRYLKNTGISLIPVSEKEMNDKAVVKFSFNQENTPSILCGRFKDMTREIFSIAHEAGHILNYEKMNTDEIRTYLCTMFISNKIGLDKLSPSGQELILVTESRASCLGLAILEEIGIEKELLDKGKKLMEGWYATYENLCQRDIVQSVREKTLKSR